MVAHAFIFLVFSYVYTYVYVLYRYICILHISIYITYKCIIYIYYISIYVWVPMYMFAFSKDSGCLFVNEHFAFYRVKVRMLFAADFLSPFGCVACSGGRSISDYRWLHFLWIASWCVRFHLGRQRRSDAAAFYDIRNRLCWHLLSGHVRHAFRDQRGKRPTGVWPQTANSRRMVLVRR